MENSLIKQMQIEKECEILKEKIFLEDKTFAEKLTRILNGKTWEIQPLVIYIKKHKGLTDLQYQYLFRLLKIEKLKNMDMENSSVLAILILCHKPFVHFVLERIKVPTNVHIDEVQSQIELGLRRAIDGFDYEQKNKFMTYAYVIMKNEALMFLRLKRLIVTGFDEKVSYKDGNDLTYADVLQDDEDFVQEVQEQIVAQNYWNILGHFNPITQFCVMARMGKYTEKYTCTKISEILNCSRSGVSRIISFALKEIRIIANDNKYIANKKYKVASIDGYRSQVQDTYHLLTEQEFFEILNSGHNQPHCHTERSECI